VTRTWVAVRLLHSLLTFEFLLMALTVVLGLFGGVRCVELIRAEPLTGRHSTDRPQNCGELPCFGNWLQKGWD